jgi:hypothetical protein
MMRPIHPDERFAVAEEFLHSFVSRIKGNKLEVKRTGKEWVESERLEERLTQQYVKAEHKRLGFTKIQGPHRRGPDFRVMQNGRWSLAEVETRWRSYLEHGHHTSPAFADVKHLIVLSHKVPSKGARELLPPHIIYIDHDHYIPWLETECRIPFRIMTVADEMQEYFVTVCPDRERDGGTCPICDDCPYCGEGLQNEATPFFGRVAAEFVALHAIGKNNEADLRRVDAESIRRYVERQMWDI